MSGKKPKKTWECNNGCDLSKGVACKHLESLVEEKNREIVYEGKKKEPQFESVSKKTNKNIDSLYYTSGAGFILPEGVKSGRYEQQFRSKLYKAGLSPIQIDILVLSFIYDNTTKEIAEELRINTLMQVVRLRTDALKTLKKRWGK